MLIFFFIGSYYEGFPNVLLEAGILGIPVVGFNAPGGIAEIIRQGENGFLVDDDNSGRNFSNAVIKAVNHNFSREKIKELTRDRFSIEKIIPQLERFFTRVYES